MTDRLPRFLGPAAATLFTAGWTIGSAVFRVPSEIAHATGSVGASMALWVLGGIVALCGAFSYSELSVRLPRAGSEYAYGMAAYGPFVGFLIAWATLLTGPASVAAVARAFADYASVLVPMDESARRLAAAAAIGVLASVAILSSRAGTLVAAMAGVAKLLAILGVIVVGLAFTGHPAAAATESMTSGGWMHYGPAFVAIVWAYDGFQSVALMAGEAKDPRRTLPIGLVAGLGLVTLAYLLLNVTYLKVLGIAGVAATPTVAATTLAAVIGPSGERLIAMLVMMCTLGTVAAQCTGYPRYFFAPAEDGLFPAWMAKLSKRAATPANAISVLAAVAVALVLSGGYAFLIRLAVLTSYPLFCVALLGAIRLRRRDGPPAGFSMPFYPLPLIVFCGGIIITCIASFLDAPVGMAYAVAVWAAGALVYRLAVVRGTSPP